MGKGTKKSPYMLGGENVGAQKFYDWIFGNIKDEISIYIDGSYYINKNVGGWSFIMFGEDIMIENSGAVRYTTNVRMEVTALLEALKHLTVYCWAEPETVVKVYTDSIYVVETARSWSGEKLEKAWRTKSNKDLWDDYLEYSRGWIVEFQHVPAHRGNRYNELCDAMAKDAVKKFLENDNNSSSIILPGS